MEYVTTKSGEKVTFAICIDMIGITFGTILNKFENLNRKCIGIVVDLQKQNALLDSDCF